MSCSSSTAQTYVFPESFCWRVLARLGGLLVFRSGGGRRHGAATRRRHGGDTIKSMKISEFFQQTRNLLSQKLVSYNFDLTFTMYFLQLFLRMCNSLAKSVAFFCHCLDFANSPMKNCDFPVQEAFYFSKSVQALLHPHADSRATSTAHSTA